LIFANAESSKGSLYRKCYRDRFGEGLRVSKVEAQKEAVENFG
jgi:hypothetical protein